MKRDAIDFERMKIGDKMKIGTFDIHSRDEQGNLNRDEEGNLIKLDDKDIEAQIVLLLDSYQTPKEE